GLGRDRQPASSAGAALRHRAAPRREGREDRGRGPGGDAGREARGRRTAGVERAAARAREDRARVPVPDRPPEGMGTPAVRGGAAMVLLALVLAAVVPPDEVIVYPDRARVSRTQTVPCPAAGPVLFDGLPAATDERSIAAVADGAQVEGLVLRRTPLAPE